MADADVVRRAGLDRWKGVIFDYWPDCAPLLDQIDDWDQLTLARYAHRTMRPPASGRVAFVGDSAHSTSPQLGQGANMALIDAATLAHALSHTDDIDAALAAYGRARHQRAFPRAERRRLDAFDFEYLKIGSTHLEIVPADEKVASGAAGSVVYWQVEDFDRALAHFNDLGAPLYRGPLAIEDDLWMCQVRDPWGNCIGLRGPRNRQETA